MREGTVCKILSIAPHKFLAVTFKVALKGE